MRYRVTRISESLKEPEVIEMSFFALVLTIRYVFTSDLLTIEKLW